MFPILLHIGMHKTGTSAVQRVFSRNSWILAAAGIHYWAPRVGWVKRASKAIDLYGAVQNRASGQGPHPKFGAPEDVLARICAKAARHWVVVSAEGLSGQDPAFAQALAPLRGTARALVYLRRQDAWVESFYRQMVKSAEVAERRPFAAFLADPWTKAHLDYPALLRRWSEALGQDAVSVRIYPPHGPLLEDFTQAAGLPRWISRLPYARNRANPSLSLDQLANLTGLPNDQLGFASQADRAAFQRGFARQNDEIRITYRPDLPELFDPALYN